MDNIIGNHISNTQKKLRKYNNLILKSKYDKTISDELIQTYIDARYYNYGVDEKIRVFYRRIYGALRKKTDELIQKEPRRKELIDNSVALFQYYFYFDNVRDNVEIDKIIESIADARIFKLNLRSAVKENFIHEFTKIVKKDIEDVNVILDGYDSKDFDLSIKKLGYKNSNCYRVNLNYNFNFPDIFSKDAIETVFNTDIVAEDRLFVEYPMIANRVLNEILDGNFAKIYICDFAVSLFKKKKKLEQLLQILDDEAAQEKIYFEIDYDEFIENRTDIFKLIKRGFNFALKTNDKIPKLSNEELKILEVFNCIIVDIDDVNKKKYKNNKIIIK